MKILYLLKSTTYLLPTVCPNCTCFTENTLSQLYAQNSIIVILTIITPRVGSLVVGDASPVIGASGLVAKDDALTIIIDGPVARDTTPNHAKIHKLVTLVYGLPT